MILLVFCAALKSESLFSLVFLYISGVKYISDYLKSDPKLKTMPWIVNTMGFNRGLGISLLKETLKLIHPTTVIEIKSRFAKKNYECSIGNFVSKNLSNCNFMTFKAMPESLNVQMGGSDNWGIPEAYKLRDIVTLSFLEKSKVMSSTFSHTVSLDSIHIQLLQCSG